VNNYSTDVLRGQYSGSAIDEKAIEIIMKVYVNQKHWSAFCKNYSTEPVRRGYILKAYTFNHYYSLTNNLYGVRNKAKRDILINLIKLNSNEAKSYLESE
jgi:hypothetical protein